MIATLAEMSKKSLAFLPEAFTRFLIAERNGIITQNAITPVAEISIHSRIEEPSASARRTDINESANSAELVRLAILMIDSTQTDISGKISIAAKG